MTTFDDDTAAGESVDLAETEAQPAEELDAAAALKAELRTKPGDWYVIHS
ncbi:MAG: transcription termination/antitermination protein NusG, partial [Mycobacterium sp.]